MPQERDSRIEELMRNYDHERRIRCFREELRKIKHALWIARAEWAAAEWNQAMNGIGKYEPEQLKRIEHLCRKRANELR